MNNIHPYSFFFELPLYAKVVLDDSNEKDFLSLMNSSFNINAYNPVIKENTTYKMRIISHNYQNVQNVSYYEGITQFELECVRTGYKILCFANLVCIEHENGDDEFVFQKIGQFPSIADLHIGRIRDYNKLLSKEKLKEITRAVGLAANGVGIGSFVYLRRIFEDLVEEAHQAALKDSAVNEDEYSRSRMVEKIDLLREYLPDFLVANKNLYGIMSKGIHELSEQECLSHFEVAKVGIEMILDEKLDKLNKKIRKEDAQRRIQEASQKISPKYM
ncbi:hypothetical protein [Hymenobacter rubidus]|uniref:hypothetical protein n=1 Tax=Hymenobacter rubidus TaxID=1441626 RepID=UPI00191DF9D2|nr:hypothetical protein [Hymenobacter rubidus]